MVAFRLVYETAGRTTWAQQGPASAQLDRGARGMPGALEGAKQTLSLPSRVASY